MHGYLRPSHRVTPTRGLTQTVSSTIHPPPRGCRGARVYDHTVRLRPCVISSACPPPLLIRSQTRCWTPIPRRNLTPRYPLEHLGFWKRAVFKCFRVPLSVCNPSEKAERVRVRYSQYISYHIPGIFPRTGFDVSRPERGGWIHGACRLLLPSLSIPDVESPHGRGCTF